MIFFFFQAEDGIRDLTVTGVQTCALPIWTFDAHASADWQAEAGFYYYTTESYRDSNGNVQTRQVRHVRWERSEEHTSELQSQSNLVCRLLLEKKKKKKII